MSRKSFFNDKTKLYYIKENGSNKQLIAITESRCFTLFNYLFVNWSKIQSDYIKKNKNKSNNEKEEVTLFLEKDTYWKLAGDLTKIETKINIGFSVSPVIVSVEMLTEKKPEVTSEEPTKEKKYISIKEASELTGKSESTIRRWIKNEYVLYKREKITGNKFRYLIDLTDMERHISQYIK